jgi:Tol biopolymer transport system component
LALTPGTRLGVYEITAQIGVGGMGEVYRATDSNLKRSVAIKVLPASVAGDADRLARFQREAEVLAALNHPNIAAIYGLEKTSDFTALVMELVEGDDLSQRIARGAIPLDEALPIAKQIADALEAAHEQGIIHRDLKPANIKIRSDGTVKVLDFGLAKAMEPTGAASASVSMSPTLTTPAMTQAGMILGSAAYMSPEQAKGRTVDKRSDVWALGAVLYEMLTGARAFQGEDITDVIAAVMKDTPNWSALPADVPPHIVTLIQRCLEKDRKARIGDMAVTRFLLAEGGALGRPSSGPAVVPAASRLRLLPWALAALFLLTTVGVSFVHFREAPVAPEKSVRFEVSPPENTDIRQFRLSPDGRHLVFVAGGAGAPRLWIRSLDSVSATPLAGTDGAAYPFWSPDGTQIGFFAQGKLKKIPTAGGLAVALCDVVDGRGGAWSRDGIMLFAPDAFGGLYRVADAGGRPVAVTTMSAPNSDRFPEFLPDGQKFLFLRTADKDAGIYAGSLSDASVTRVLPELSNATYVPGFVLFRRDNTLMAQPFDPARLQTTGGVVPIAEQVSIAGNTGYGAFTSSQDGTVAYRSGLAGGRQLAWLDRSGKRLSVVSKPDEIKLPALSPDGKIVVFSVGNRTAGYSELWLQNLESGVLSKFTFGPGTSATPVWSPDGGRIAFENQPAATATASGRMELLPVAGAGRPEVILPGPYNSMTVTDWSRDGKLIVFNSRSEKTKDDVWLLPMEGERKAVPFAQTSANENNGRFSPDGAWMAYESDQSGRSEIYVQHVPPNGSQFQISSAGAVNPRWSRDGKELFYLEAGQNGAKVMSVPVKLGATFERGQARLLFEGFHGPGLEPSADGQRFLALVPAEGDAPAAAITVVTNWQATLKK